jgi:hypothetical protein
VGQSESQKQRALQEPLTQVDLAGQLSVMAVTVQRPESDAL